MKKTIIMLTAIVILALVSCHREQAVSPLDGKTILHFGIGQTTKADVTGSVDMVWADGDEISVDPGIGFKTFTLVGGAGTASGTFQINEIIDVKASATAVYPSNLTPAWVDDKLQITLPDTYTWSSAGIKAPMISWVNNPYPYFNLMGGTIKLDVYNIPVTATKLVFTTVNQNVSGNFALNASNAIETSAGDNNTVTITFAAGSSLNKTFYVPVPTGTYTNSTFSIQSESETFKTVRAASITVTKGALIFAPAVNCGSVPASITVYNDAVGTTEWHSYQKDLTGLEEGYRVQFTYEIVDPSIGTNITIQTSANGSDWTDIIYVRPDDSLPTTMERPLTQTQAEALINAAWISISPYNIKVKSVVILPPVVETVLWKGSLTLGSWENDVRIPAAFWSDARVGKTVVVYYQEDKPAWEWVSVNIKEMTGEWPAIVSRGYNAAGYTTLEMSIDAEILAKMKANGIAVQGSDATITKITLR